MGVALPVRDGLGCSRTRMLEGLVKPGRILLLVDGELSPLAILGCALQPFLQSSV